MVKIGGKKTWMTLCTLGILAHYLTLGFPIFTSEEARIAFRGFTLAHFGTDEFGRAFPALFNSLADYQLPVTSYVTALGVSLFGKSDLGARLAFMIFGAGQSYMVYLIAKIYSEKPYFWFSSLAVSAFSPALIFFSKIPNEWVIITFFMTLLFYILTRVKIRYFTLLTIATLLYLTSKAVWFTLPIFVLAVVWAHRRGSLMNILKLPVLFLLFSCVAFSLYLSIPQGARSLLENNFPIFNSVTLVNGINALRGESVDSGIPVVVGRLIFNKIHFLFTGALHWFSGIGPLVYFAQFDATGRFGFFESGVFAKSLTLPFLLGLWAIIRKNERKLTGLIIYILALTFPLTFLYPINTYQYTLLAFPFMVIIISLGFLHMNRFLSCLVIGLMVFESLWNLWFLLPEHTASATLRPIWAKELSLEVFDNSGGGHGNFMYISDDIAEDFIPFLAWYTPYNKVSPERNLGQPYRFRQSIYENVRVIGLSDELKICPENPYPYAYLSLRDLQRLEYVENDALIEKKVNDLTGREIYSLVRVRLCTK